MNTVYLRNRRKGVCLTCPSKCKEHESKEWLESSGSTCPLQRWKGLDACLDPKPINARVFVREKIEVSRSKAEMRPLPFQTGDKSVWGPYLWGVLHASAQESSIDAGFIERFTKMVQCGECRNHWKKLLIEIPFRPGDQYQWSVDVHNAVNIRLGKPIWTP